MSSRGDANRNRTTRLAYRAVDRRGYQPGDETAIRELFRLTFGADMSESFWRWRFLANPAAANMPLIHLMWDGPVLAGHYAVSPCILRLGHESSRAALSMTTMTHPDYRGRGIFTELAESAYAQMADQGFELVFGFPNEASHASFVRQLRWADVYEIPMLQTPARPDGGTIDDVTRIERFTDGNDRSAEALSTYLAYVRRDATYLNWRYLDHPENRYHAFGYRGDEGGYAICKLHAAPDSVQCDIVDLVADTRTCLDALLRRVNRFAVEQGADRLNLWVNRNHPHFGAVERAGFVHGGPVTWFGYRTIGRSRTTTALAAYDSWYLTMGDSDVF